MGLLDPSSFKAMIAYLEIHDFDYDLAIHSLSYGPELVSLIEDLRSYKIVCYNAAFKRVTWQVESECKKVAVLGAICAHTKDNGHLFWEIYSQNKITLEQQAV